MQQALDSVITLAKLQFTQKKWVFFFSQIDNQKSPNDDRILHLVPEFGEWFHSFVYQFSFPKFNFHHCLWER